MASSGRRTYRHLAIHVHRTRPDLPFHHLYLTELNNGPWTRKNKRAPQVSRQVPQAILQNTSPRPAHHSRYSHKRFIGNDVIQNLFDRVMGMIDVLAFFAAQPDLAMPCLRDHFTQLTRI